MSKRSCISPRVRRAKTAVVHVDCNPCLFTRTTKSNTRLHTPALVVIHTICAGAFAGRSVTTTWNVHPTHGRTITSLTVKNIGTTTGCNSHETASIEVVWHEVQGTYSIIPLGCRALRLRLFSAGGETRNLGSTVRFSHHHTPLRFAMVV